MYCSFPAAPSICENKTSEIRAMNVLRDSLEYRRGTELQFEVDQSIRKGSPGQADVRSDPMLGTMKGEVEDFDIRV